MKRSYTHTGYTMVAFSPKKSIGSSSDFSIDRHTLHRPLSSKNSTDTEPTIMTAVVSCPSTLHRIPSNPIDIPYKGNASWSIREEAAELEQQESKYNHATWRMYHLINDARRVSKTNGNNAMTDLPSFPALPSQLQTIPIAEDDVGIFKIDF